MSTLPCAGTLFLLPKPKLRDDTGRYIFADMKTVQNRPALSLAAFNSINCRRPVPPATGVNGEILPPHLRLVGNAG